MPAAHATIVIPARLGSTRFPEKVLADETGRPMVQHVVEAARRAVCAQRVVIAADDPRIIEAVAPFGTDAVLTRRDHPNGTSRLAEAAAILRLPMDAMIVNVQGDEPEVEASVIDAAAGALAAGDAHVATAAAPLLSREEAQNPNIVKVVMRPDGSALYFSRSAIPHHRGGEGGWLRHVGIYAYRRAFLERYASLSPTPLEAAESLEQLRVLEHGFRIAVAIVTSAGASGIDTREQYAAFVERWRSRR